MSIPSWARVGAEVVCIKREPWNLLAGVEKDQHGPCFGDVCVIQGFAGGAGRLPLCLFLGGYSDAYSIACFRPVKTIEDDISEHFAQHLKTPVRTSIRAGERA
jgi:hypothetical protein